MNESISLEHAPIDQKWFFQLENATDFIDIHTFQDDSLHRTEQKNLFLSGKIDHPHFNYPNINVDEIQTKQQQLRSLKTQILNQETDPDVKQAYRWRINEKIAEAGIILAAKKGNSKKFMSYAKFVYGEPSSDVFAAVIQDLRWQLEEDIKNPNPNISTAATFFLEKLPDSIATVQNTPPKSDTIQTVKKDTQKNFGNIINVEEEFESYDSQKIKNHLEKALSKIEFDHNWKAVLIDNPNKTAISINRKNKTIDIPLNRNVTSKDKLESISLDEVAGHIYRSLKGMNSRLLILGHGLDRHLKGDEGSSIVRASSLKNKSSFGLPTGYLAIGLAHGLDGQPRNFKQVYETMYSYYYYKNLKSGKSPEDAHQSAQNNAYTRSYRTFRGTNCKEPGIYHPRDIIYKDGAIGTWMILDENNDRVSYINIGKLDPANDRHIAILARAYDVKDEKELIDTLKNTT